MLKGLNTRPIRKYGDQSLIPPRVSNSPGFTVLTRTSCSWTVLRDFVFCGKRLQRPLQPNLHFQIPENEAQCGERTCPEQLSKKRTEELPRGSWWGQLSSGALYPQPSSWLLCHQLASGVIHRLADCRQLKGQIKGPWGSFTSSCLFTSQETPRSHPSVILWRSAQNKEMGW